MSNIKKNIGYQTMYEVLNTCLPLITAPYLARVLGATQLGIFSYTQSIANYFVLLAALGVKSYGTRAIAESKKNMEESARIFDEIFSFQLITATCSTVIYSLYCLLICRQNTLIAYIQIISVAACIFDINWLFSGLEKFKITVMRSTVIRLITVSLIFLLVKKPEDLWIYTLLMVGGQFLGIVILWGYIKPLIGGFHFRLHGIKKHIKPNLYLFIPHMAMSVYHLMDKTMLGYISTFEESGYYYNTDKTINIPVGVIIGIGTVMLPHITHMISIGKKDEANRIFLVSIEGVSVVSIAMTSGIIAIINEFVPFFFGEGYDPCVFLTTLLSPVLILKGLSLTVRSEYLIPNKKDRIYINSVIVGAVSNLVANCILIPGYGATGAVIGTLIAESVSCLWQLVFIVKEVNVIKSILKSIPYCLFGSIMVLAVRIIADNIHLSLVYTLLIEIPVGAIVYMALCALYWKITKNNLFAVFKLAKHRS